MPFVLLVLAALFITAGVRGTQGELFRLMREDFTGRNNFVVWFATIFAIGAFGYIPGVRPLANGMLLLVMVVLLISNRGFFARLMEQLNAGSGNAPGLPSLPTVPAMPGLPTFP